MIKLCFDNELVPANDYVIYAKVEEDAPKYNMKTHFLQLCRLPNYHPISNTSPYQNLSICHEFCLNEYMLTILNDCTSSFSRRHDLYFQRLIL